MPMTMGMTKLSLILLDASQLRVTRGLPREIVRIIEIDEPIAELG